MEELIQLRHCQLCAGDCSGLYADANHLMLLVCACWVQLCLNCSLYWMKVLGAACRSEVLLHGLLGDALALLAWQVGCKVKHIRCECCARSSSECDLYWNGIVSFLTT